MVYFPIRKCYYVAKISVVLLLVLTIFSFYEHWRGGRRGSEGSFIEDEYERQILEDELRIVPGLGEGGVAVQLTGEDHRLGQESEKKLAMNVYLSDRIAYNRTLSDHRNPACQRIVYDAELPSASVVIIFHNEPYSVVVRTVWSVINSARRDRPWHQQANFVDRATGRIMKLGYRGQPPDSPLVYLKEIILVDDNSTLPELRGKLSHYVRTRLPAGLIRILRLPDRVGLTQARLAGARYATADSIIFLDAHCEVQPDWLRPLLQRMKDDPHAVTMPIIDVIESDDFYYSVQEPASFQVGGFTFMGHFTWIEVNEKEKKRRGSDIAPTWSPTMAGGLFAINREYYWELGAYDEQMAGWGGENLEMSFRVWQCGGSLETVPCSRVGHVFRAFHPYGMPASSDTHGINTARMAEVWMDDYKELFYLHRPDLRNNPKIGDVTHRKILREKLHCKSFQWYLDNIYPEKFVPVRDAYGFGRFQNKATGLCLDSLQRDGAGVALGVYPCHATLQPTQYFALADGQLRDEERCATLKPYSRDPSENELTKAGRQLVMVDCRKNTVAQKWRVLPSKQLQHSASGLCLDAGWESGADVSARACRPAAPSQLWDIDYTDDTGFQLDANRPPTDLELKLKKLRGASTRRRIGRSLMSVTSAPKRHKKKHRRSRKHNSRNRSKNRFILKLVRTLANGSAQHLEVDVHCRHARLLPNNSFVRDLVALLTDHDIKVINNGRVFERNKVTELGIPDALRRGRTVGTTTNTPPQQMSVQPKLWPKKRRRPLAVAPGALHENIVIEDFVDVTPNDLSPTPMEPLKPVVKRTQDHSPPRLHPPGFSSRARLPAEMSSSPPTSAEEAPVPLSGETKRAGDTLDSGVDGNGYNDDFFMTDSNFPTNGSKVPQEMESNYLQYETAARSTERTELAFRAEDGPEQQAEPRAERRAENRVENRDELDGKPLKVVMKSNLSFNLGNEFFKWQKGDEVNELLEELATPLEAADTTTVSPDSGSDSSESDSTQEA